MKLKRVCAFCASALMLASSALPASAANITDTKWSFELSYNSTSHVTPAREKTNTSGTYVYYQGGTPDTLQCDVLNSENQSMCRKTGPIDVGKKGLIAQYVYEEGFRWAKLKLFTSETQGGAEGVWSPDSVGSYPYINL